MIQRTAFKVLENELKNKKITSITGARQVGKTTAMKYVYKKVKDEANFITFDDESIKNLFETNIDLFITQHIKPYKYLFIDEVQYAKSAGKHLKYIHDTQNIKVFISGSSKPEIAIKSLQYLVGRVSLIEMHPLSFEEFVNYKAKNKLVLLDEIRDTKDLRQLQSEFEEYLMFGGYPEVVKEVNFDNKKKILQDLISVYLLKEIKDILGYKSSYSFENLLRTLATTNGKLAKNSTLSQTLDISWHKITEYIEVLVKTNIVLRIPPFFSNKTKEITKTPKIYFNDIGFVNSLLNNFSRLDQRVDKGEILENFVACELIKKEENPKFWNKQLSEVDFIIEKNNEVIAIECKSIEKKVSRSAINFSKEYSPKKFFVFNLNFYKEMQKDNTNYLFLHYINLAKLDFYKN